MKCQRWMLPLLTVGCCLHAMAQSAPQGSAPQGPGGNVPSVPGGAAPSAPALVTPSNYYQQAPSAERDQIYQPAQQGQAGKSQEFGHVTMNHYGQDWGQHLGPEQAADQTPQSAPQNLPPLPSAGANEKEDFDAVVANYLSVTPDQIRALRRDIDARSRAASELPGPAPTPETNSISVSLSPGATPPAILGFINQTSSFVVVDSTGTPWPVENFHVGNASAFKVERLDLSSSGSSFTVNALTPYARTNLILKLAGLSTPVAIDLIAGQKTYDERVDVHIEARGPNAVATSGSLMPATDSRLNSILDGVAPPNGKPLTVSGGDSTTRAWLLPNGRMVVRTTLKIVSPASPSFESSPDGTNVYEFVPTSPLRGISNGQFVDLSVEGW